MVKKIDEISEDELLLPGTRVCSGCGLSIAYRLALKALGKNTIITIPAGCSTVLQGMFPISSAKVTVLNTAFETAASSASGIVASLKAQKKENDFTVVAWAGDGGTADIGIQALSGSAERGDNFIYVCYDNEAYMNTGTQRSGATPYGALTTTTPSSGKMQVKKNMPQIMAAHNIPYIATCCASYPVDFYNKFIKAKSIKGTKYIHIFAPCPPGWGFPTSKTVKLGKLAVETGLFELYEIENGILEFTDVTKNIYSNKFKRKQLADYFSTQGRFAKLPKEIIERFQIEIDKKFENQK